MTPEHKGIWHRHKDWPNGMWVKYLDYNDIQGIDPTLCVVSSLKGEFVNHLLERYQAYFLIEDEFYKREFESWLKDYIFEPYFPGDWTKRSDECKFIWVETIPGLLLTPDVVVRGVWDTQELNEKGWPVPPYPHDDTTHHYCFKVYQNLDTKQWNITEAF